MFSDAFVTPSSTVWAVAGSPPSARIRLFVSSNSKRSISSDGSSSVSPALSTVTLRSIWRTMISMCLSLIVTPWDRYTFWTSATRKRWTVSTPLISSSSFGLSEPSVSGSPAETASPSATRSRAECGTGYSRTSTSSVWRVSVLPFFVMRPAVGGLDLDEVLALTGAGQQLALRHLVAVGDEHLVLRRELERGVVGLAVRDAHQDLLVAGGRRHLDGAVDLGHDRLALRDARLEQLLDARQALGDVLAGDAAGVEGPHRQLRARLADRLRRDDADRLADLDQVAGGQVAAVAHAAHAVACGAGER